MVKRISRKKTVKRLKIKGRGKGIGARTPRKVIAHGSTGRWKTEAVVSIPTFTYPYELVSSARFNRVDSLSFTPTSASTNSKRFSCRFWLKRGEQGNQYICSSGPTNDEDAIGFTTNDQLFVSFDSNVGANLITDFAFRDFAKPFHVGIEFNSTAPTAADRLRMYINGFRVVDFLTEVYPALNYDLLNLNQNTKPQYVGRRSGQAGYRFGGYLSDFIMSDGYAYATGYAVQQVDNLAVPREWDRFYGDNGYHLKFEDDTDIGLDSSGNNNDFTKTAGMDADDIVPDVPNEVYAVLNGANRNTAMIVRDGNLDYYSSTAATWRTVLSTLSFTVDNGMYAEGKAATVNYNCIGVAKVEKPVCNTVTYLGDDELSWGMANVLGNWTKVHNGVTTSFGVAVQANDVMMIAVKNGNVWFGVNGTWLGSGNPATGANPAFTGLDGHLLIGFSGTDMGNWSTADFGQHGFTHTVPNGFGAVKQSNLTEPSIIDSTTGFYSKYREGTGASVDIDDVNFDVSLGALLCVKSLSGGGAFDPQLMNTEMGVQKRLETNTTFAQISDITCVTGFNTDGYTLSSTSDVNYALTSTQFLDRLWRKDPDYGFDIVSEDGNGVAGKQLAHNVGGVPELVLAKRREVDGGNWSLYCAYVASLPETYRGLLTTAAFVDNNTYWNDEPPTADYIELGNSADINSNGNAIDYYIWRSVLGFSKVFYYWGNGNLDGPFIDLGFSPATLFLHRAIVAGANWPVFDRKSKIQGRLTMTLFNSNANQDTAVWADADSTGFKIKSTSLQVNTLNNLYVGVATAFQPGKYSNGAFI